MLTEHFTGTVAVLFMIVVLLVGGLIGFPTMQTAEAAVNIEQSKSQTDACGLIFVPALCTNIGDNTAIVTPAPSPTQDIDVTGTQNMDQTNTCDDDDAGVPGECLNDSFGNIFFLDHSQTADMTVQSFEQDIQNVNDCFVFDQCTNFGGNAFVIQDDDIPGTDVDVNVGSSIQEISQVNHCDGSVGSIEPDPTCSNFRANNLLLGNFLQFPPEDGAIKLGENFQSSHQENVCEKGSVGCTNFGG